jgi:thiol-disulfide isomerase/thioredoxin
MKSVLAILCCFFAQRAFSSEPRTGYSLVQHLTALEQHLPLDERLVSGRIKPNKNIIIVWASWCSHCKLLLKQLSDRGQWSKCASNISLISIKDDRNEANKFLTSISWKGKNIFDDNGFLKKVIGFQVIPTILMLDKEFNLTEIYSGKRAKSVAIKISNRGKKFCE